MSEDDVLRLARAHAPDIAVAQATESVADARAQAAGRFPNPTLGWSREAILGAQPSSQDIVLATVELDIARPLAERSLAEAASASTRVGTALLRTNAALRALLLYYEVVAAQRSAAVAAEVVGALEEASRVLGRRESVGQGSGYESARIAVALDLARSRQAEATSDLQGTLAQLAALLRVAREALVVDSDLALVDMPNEATLLASVATGHTAVREAAAAQELIEQATRQARWAWVPTVQLAAGLKRVSDFGGAQGYVVGVTLDLPVFQRGQGVSAEATAQRALTRTRAEALERELAAEVSHQYALYMGARDELGRFQESVSASARALLTAAQSGYQRGERSVAELLDAQRTVLEVTQRELALLVAAKNAEARLRAATGGLE